MNTKWFCNGQMNHSNDLIQKRFILQSIYYVRYRTKFFGNWDKDPFVSNEMCCACGGGCIGDGCDEALSYFDKDCPCEDGNCEDEEEDRYDPIIPADIYCFCTECSPSDRTCWKYCYGCVHSWFEDGYIWEVTGLSPMAENVS